MCNNARHLAALGLCCIVSHEVNIIVHCNPNLYKIFELLADNDKLMSHKLFNI